MKLVKARRSYGHEISIAPLIDVVFLLIIFFMTVSQFTRVEVELIELPKAKTGEPGGTGLGGRLIVNVRQDKSIWVSGKTYTPASLRAMLAKVVAKKPANEITVLVRGDRRMPWGTAAEVMDACAAHGISQVRVAVVEQDTSD